MDESKKILVDSTVESSGNLQSSSDTKEFSPSRKSESCIEEH